MAAEKLTKGRLIQIFVMMVLLVVAFIWRTMTHMNQEPECEKGTDCQAVLTEKDVDRNIHPD